jgi:hypothetical protein
MGPAEIWPMIAGGAAVVFGAGQVVEKVRNGKYINKEYCGLMHANLSENMKSMKKDIARIVRWIDNVPEPKDDE